ncbi:hypothetical protein HDU83_007851 [Entophlyctis luteolus]|nr:hypothetical protein HDU83_007851 [Entophlyctis luteolus]
MASARLLLRAVQADTRATASGCKRAMPPGRRYERLAAGLQQCQQRARLSDSRRIGELMPGKEVGRLLNGNSAVLVNAPAGSTGATGARSRVLQAHLGRYAANDPMEDSLSVDRIVFPGDTTAAGCGSDEAAGASSKDPEFGPFNLFGVYDGHWLPHCSLALSEILPKVIQDTLNDSSEVFVAANAATRSIPENAKSDLPAKLSSSFMSLDATLLSYPFSTLGDEFFDMPVDKVLTLFDGEEGKKRRDDFQEAVLPAVTGACALTAIVRDNLLVVANAGDCRAVLGSRNPDGTFSAIDLSNDHTLKNLAEKRRILSEHPEGEAKHLTQHGRVLGGLMPSRCFGDAKYKWPLEVTEKVEKLEERLDWRIPKPFNCKTPPYITAAPEVIEHELSNKDAFLIIATDGLFDDLSSQNAVDTVASLIVQPDGAFPPWLSKLDSDSLPAFLHPVRVKTVVDNSGRVINVADNSSNDNSAVTGGDVVVAGGVNLATSLIRAALVEGKGRKNSMKQIEERSTVKPPGARFYRDDMTCIVLVF